MRSLLIRHSYCLKAAINASDNSLEAISIFAISIRPLLKFSFFILSPYYMEPNKTDTMRARMDEYIAICRELAEKHGCIFVDFQGMFDRVFAHRHSCSIAWDRVHPNEMGSTIMAREFLKHCDYDFNREA